MEQDGDHASGKSSSSRSTGLVIFKCTGFGDCQMIFQRSEHLARHVRKHTGDKPFKCHCGRQFSRLDNVRQHAATVHSDDNEANREMLSRMVKIHSTLAKVTSKKQIDSGMVIKDDEIPSSMRQALLEQSTLASAKSKEKGKAKAKSRGRRRMDANEPAGESTMRPGVDSHYSGSSARSGSPVDHLRSDSHYSALSPSPALPLSPHYSMAPQQSHAYQPVSSGSSYMPYTAHHSDEGPYTSNMHPPTSYPDPHHQNANSNPESRALQRSRSNHDSDYRTGAGMDDNGASEASTPRLPTPPGSVNLATSNALAAAAAAAGPRGSVTLPSISELLPTPPFMGRPPTAGGPPAPPMPPPELPATQYVEFYDTLPALPSSAQYPPQYSNSSSNHYPPPARQHSLPYLPDHAPDSHNYPQPPYMPGSHHHSVAVPDTRNGYQFQSQGLPFAQNFGFDSVPSQSRNLSHPQYPDPGPAPFEQYYPAPASSAPPPSAPTFAQHWSPRDQQNGNSKITTYYGPPAGNYSQQQLPSPAPSNSHSTGQVYAHQQHNPHGSHDFSSSLSLSQGGGPPYPHHQHPSRQAQPYGGGTGPPQRPYGSSNGHNSYYAPPPLFPPLSNQASPDLRRYGPPSPRSGHVGGFKRDREEQGKGGYAHMHEDERGPKRALGQVES